MLQELKSFLYPPGAFSHSKTGGRDPGSFALLPGRVTGLGLWRFGLIVLSFATIMAINSRHIPEVPMMKSLFQHARLKACLISMKSKTILK